jgi:hypothetical protein
LSRTRYRPFSLSTTKFDVVPKLDRWHARRVCTPRR